MRRMDNFKAMPSRPSPASQQLRHWDSRYADSDATQVSWYQPKPVMSLDLLDVLGVTRTAPIIDVGGGASFLIDELLDRGYSDLTVLDVSSKAIEIARRRVGKSAHVRWLIEDVLTWRPERSYQLWHDRALFHFLTTASEQATYLSVMRTAIRDGGALIMATFAADGPERCSGLPVTRYDGVALERVLAGCRVVERRREDHVTPAGVVQPFTWIAATCGSSERSSGLAGGFVRGGDPASELGINV